MSLNGNKIALITGANRGIGSAIAEKLKMEGYSIIATARKHDDLIQLTDKGYHAINLDVSIDESIDCFFKTLKKSNIVPDVLVNNAGASQINLLPRVSFDEWNYIINTNLSSVFKITQGLLPGMSRKKFGRVINISSVLGSMPQKGFSHYIASKAGIEGLTRSLALEYASKGVTINCVSPGFVDTDMLSILGENGISIMKSNIPVGYVAEPIDIAELVSFLSSNGARYITGETIHINGGLYFK